MAVTTSCIAPWAIRLTSQELADPDLHRIITFFLFHTPCPGLSNMGKTLGEYGWTNPSKKPYYLVKQLLQVAGSNVVLSWADKYEELATELENKELKDNFPSKPEKERGCLYDDKDNQLNSLFFHLRNAFAHGRFTHQNVDGDVVFILEDIARGNKVSARMILKKRTLLNWINLIEEGEHPYAPPASKDGADEKLKRRKKK